MKAGVKTLDKEVDNQIDTAVNKEADKARAKADARAEQKRQESNQPSAAQGTENLTGDGQPSGQQGGGMLGAMFSNKVDLKYNESYSFTSRIYMVTETYDKKDVMKMDMYIFYSANHPSMGIETKLHTVPRHIPKTLTMTIIPAWELKPISPRLSLRCRFRLQ